MGRIFGRGELPRVLLVVIASIGEGHGYAIMQELQRRVGGNWKPSPGAIYPALLTLQDAGLIDTEDRDGSRIYRLTEHGRAALAQRSQSAGWESLSARAEASSQQITLTGLVRDFQASLPTGKGALTESQADRLREALAQATQQITTILNEGETNG